MSEVNSVAPGFTLKNTKKEDVSLSNFKGNPVVLAFYPGAFTGVCDTEMCKLKEDMTEFNKMNATVLGISVDSPWANGAFADKYELNFELLSDLDRSATKDYNLIFEGLGGIEGYTCANRGVIIIDSEGVIRYRWVAEPNPGVEPNYEEIKETVKNL
ncbi:MAG: redoxin domain-containing protein [Candidatus Neomarinimicrobiota bacterium]